MDATNQQYKILSWNVRGMNNTAKAGTVINIFKPDLVFIQETKMVLINSTIIRNSLWALNMKTTLCTCQPLVPVGVF
jgi:exonuclease III